MRRSTRTLSGIKEGKFDELESQTLNVGTRVDLPAQTYIDGTLYSSAGGGGVGSSGRQLTGDSTLGDTHDDTVTIQGKLEGYTDHLVINDNLTVEGTTHDTIIEGDLSVGGDSVIDTLKLKQDGASAYTTVQGVPSVASGFTQRCYLRADGSWVSLFGGDGNLQASDMPDRLTKDTEIFGSLTIGASSQTQYNDHLELRRGSLRIGNNRFQAISADSDEAAYNVVLNGATNFSMYNTWDSTFQHGGTETHPGTTNRTFHVNGLNGNTTIGGSLQVASGLTIDGTLTTDTLKTDSFYITEPNPADGSCHFEMTSSASNKFLKIHTPTGSGTNAFMFIGDTDTPFDILQLNGTLIINNGPSRFDSTVAMNGATVTMGTATAATAATVNGTLNVTGAVTIPEVITVGKGMGHIRGDSGAKYCYYNPSTDRANNNNSGAKWLFLGDTTRSWLPSAQRWQGIHLNCVDTHFMNTPWNTTGTQLGTLVKIWGDLEVTGVVTASSITSDIRLKRNITTTTSKWDFVKGLQIKDYTRIESESEETGIIAQDLELLDPVMVVDYKKHTKEAEEGIAEVKEEETTETYKAIKINSIVFSIAKALQEAQTRIEALEAK